jgi:hypothetical protein
MDCVSEKEMKMSTERRKDNLVNQKVTYTLQKDGQFYIVENVPARVDLETGEQFFAPETVEQLHQIILGQNKPVRTIQTPVFSFM